MANDFFKVRPSYGKCEVILYSPGHNTAVTELSDSHMKKLVDLWCERFACMSADEKIKYVFPFENRGEAVGVTMPHPHGQIYGYSVIPKKLQLETASAREYYEKNGKCLFCDMLENELRDGRRIIFQNEHFTVLLPFFTEYPYGVYIFANSHKQTLLDFTEEERVSLGLTIRDTVGMLDSLFGYRFPYICLLYTSSGRIPQSRGRISGIRDR